MSVARLRTSLLVTLVLLAPRSGLAAVAAGAEGVRPAPADPAQPGLLARAFPLIGAHYLHPDAADPREMLRAGVQALEEAGPDVVVTEVAGVLTVRARGEERQVPVADGVDLTRVSTLLSNAAAWVAARRPQGEEPPQGGYEAVALRGALSVIDRHSQVITGAGLEDFQTRFEGTLVGIGARIGRRGKDLLVLRPFPDTPAERAGLRPNDVVTHIDGHPADALSTEDAVERIRGPAFVPVVLTVRRPGEKGPRAFVILREKVVAPSVESERLDGDVGLFYIDHFSKETSSEFDGQIQALQRERPLSGVILDLRDNQGGSMVHSARIVNTFVDEGVLVRTEGRDGRAVDGLTAAVPAEPGRKRYDGPVVVLVNGRTASGAEIVAGGLKVLGRSLTIGSQTYGKGTVQKVFPLADGVQMKLTVARYLVPGDVFINQVGITPDVVTGQIWLDPLDPTLPDTFDEPPELVGREAGQGGLDARRRPGSGREVSRDGTQANAELALFYPRVLPAWRPGAPAPPPAGSPEDEVPAPPVGLGMSNAPGDAGEPVWNDVELALAYRIVQRAASADRRDELLPVARDVVEEEVRRQAARMEEQTLVRSIRWTRGSPTRWLDRAPARGAQVESALLRPPPTLPAELRLPAALVAGEPAEAALTVRNTSGQPLVHLRAVLRSSSDALDGAGFPIGDLMPDEVRTVTVRVEPPLSASTRLDPWRLYLLDDDGPLGGPYQGFATTRGELAQPTEVMVSSTSTPEGAATRLAVSTRIHNLGERPTGELRLRFGDPPDNGIDRLERWKTVPPIQPGETAEVDLHLLLRPTEGKGRRPIPLFLTDTRSGGSTELTFDPLAPSPKKPAWIRPATVQLRAPDPAPTAPPARGRTPYMLRGVVEAKQGITAVEVFLGSDKLWATASRSGAEPGRLSFEVAADLHVGPNRVTVRTRTTDGLRRSTVGWVLGELPPDDPAP